MNRKPITFEVCIDSVEGALAASRGGADRLELCSALSEGGLTPSYGLVQAVLRVVNLPVMMMIRCRGGDFEYSDLEMDVMLRDVEVAKALGVHGVVFGALLNDGSIDVASTRRVSDAARPLELTFHRAFDEPNVDANRALAELKQLGVNRLLTSGQAVSAEAGSEQLAALVGGSDNVIVMPGAGVQPENAKQIIRATMACELHGSASAFCERKGIRVTSEHTVRAIRQALDELQGGK